MEKESINVLSNPDFELRFKKNRYCQYHIYHPEYNAGLIVYIPGFGADLGEYTEVFCKKVAAQYQLASMSVEYFCINSRPDVGAEIVLEEGDLQKIEAIIPNFTEGSSFIEKVFSYAEANKVKIRLTASLKPKRGEYQNFGVLASLDILNAIKDAVDRYGIDVNNIILIGSSYGGYLANMVTKVSPGYIRAVFDNSSWARVDLDYVVGRDLNKPEFHYTFGEMDRVRIDFFVKSPWTLSPGLPHSFDEDKMTIRSFYADQTAQMAAQGGEQTYYYFYHSDCDTIAPTAEKIGMVQAMVSNGFKNIRLNIANEADVDGVFIKSLAHGMEMSMLKFFDLAYQDLIASNIAFTAKNSQTIVYNLEKCAYHFDVSQSPIVASIIDYD